jgi:hypothetical protein
LTGLQTLLFSGLESVGGTEKFYFIPQVPYSAVSSLNSALISSDRDFTEIGCCFVFDRTSCSLGAPENYPCD